MTVKGQWQVPTITEILKIMASKGLFYIKPYVSEFERKIRLYLDDCVNSKSCISTYLIDSMNPNIIECDDYGEHVYLDLIYKTVEGQIHTLKVCFDIVESDGYDFILADDVLQNYYYDSEGIMFDGGEVRVYTRDE